MEPIKIWINIKDPDYLSIKNDFREQLKDLETIKYRKIKKPIGTGELGYEQVVGYVIENYDKLLVLVFALINITKYIIKRHKAHKKDKKHIKRNHIVVVIIIGDNKLTFPANRKAENTFINNIKD